MRRIVDSDPTRYVLILAAIGGIFSTLDRASEQSSGDRIEFEIILLAAVLVGTLAGILYLYIAGALVHWTGTWIGGRAPTVRIRAALAWGSVPALWVSLLWVPELMLFGQEMFTTNTPRMDANPQRTFVLLGLLVVEFVGAVWAFVATLKCVGEVQGFSAWMALANVLLAAALLIVPIFVIATAIRFAAAAP